MQFINLKEQYKTLKVEIDKEIEKVLVSGQYISGSQVELFENQFSEYLGVKNVICCASGTDALQLIYMATQIDKNQGVFVPDMTFISTVEPACMLGAVPVFCDIDPKTYNICPLDLEAKIRKALAEGVIIPKYIVAVDFLGNPCEFDKIANIAQKYELILVEDSAQGTGAVYKNRKCGSFGYASATSFFPTKPLGGYGDGGAVMTDDDGLAEVIRSLRTHGMGKNKYDNIRIGLNSRLDTIQAAILSVKLKYLDREIEVREKKAETYNHAFKDILTIPHVNSDCRSAFAQYTVLADDRNQRDRIMRKLAEKSIPTIIYYPNGLHNLPVFRDSYNANDHFPNVDTYEKNSVALPFSPYLSNQEQSAVIDAVLSCFS